MNFRTKGLFSILRFNPTPCETFSNHHHQQCRTLVRVRLKWVKNRSLDHIIDTHTDLKAACLLKDAINRSSTGFLTSKSINDWQKLLGLTVPTLRFIRRYPTLFEEFPHPRYPSLPCFRLTNIANNLHSEEQRIFQTHEADTVQRLCRVLMMMKNKMVPFQSLNPLKWDLGLPDDFDRTLIRKYPDCFRVVKGPNGLCLKLEQWREEFSVSELQKSHENAELGGGSGGSGGYRQFKRGYSALGFPMSFPRGYGAQNKVKAWMEEFQKLPYISPYEDSRGIDPNSDLMEKRVVGVLHEFLSLTIYKKTKRNYLRSLREELNLPHKFTRIFTRYPGIFYLSLKCKTTTVAIREGYRRGKLTNPHPLSCLREKFYHVMRTGLLYRGKGVGMIPQPDNLGNVEEDGTQQEELEEEEYESGDEFCEDEEDSEVEVDSDED
ncbi:protein WHAT'S THIS FACTOR 9, mitochondrial-like [Cornus florida]|uniref:protein WHAT'S THIS FACTOR 9, mitochondrial-like n=1 Tax=Cornus florida TaxID=4283 RepID=UPI0028997821|nr:protein WHAT'S THIS FACTOR 9, mitochondrial-like [Cornus florida]XP_059649250.1 protein WHAT'S THIS FACTOR 9, mitochondrial-like [Cornus florida]XP_059649252.1 protein WHAT'S THIS FACTOR 9, mitochondrial-like [Cornus florida]